MFEASYWPLTPPFWFTWLLNHFRVLPLGRPSFGAHPWDLEATFFSNPYNFCIFNTIALNLFVSFLGQLLLNITQGLKDLEVSFSKLQFSITTFPCCIFSPSRNRRSLQRLQWWQWRAGRWSQWRFFWNQRICHLRSSQMTWLEVAPSRDSTSWTIIWIRSVQNFCIYWFCETWYTVIIYYTLDVHPRH